MVDCVEKCWPFRWRVEFSMAGRSVAGLIDMMRYDRATPKSARDSDLITAMINNGGYSQEPVTISFVVLAENKNWRPTSGRWASFGWRSPEESRLGVDV